MDNTEAGKKQGVVDARGHCCPAPTLRLRKALRNAAIGDVLELLATDPMARIDVPHFIAQTGHLLLASVSDASGGWRFTVQKRA